MQLIKQTPERFEMLQAAYIRFQTWRKAMKQHQLQLQSAAAGSPQPNPANTPGGTQRSSFSLSGQAAQNVSDNLHIPANKHRNSIIAGQQGPGTPQSNGVPTAGSPMRMPHMLGNALNNAGTPPQHQQSPANQQKLQRLLDAGIPVQPNRQMMAMAMAQQADLARVRPEAILNGGNPNAIQQLAHDRRLSSGGAGEPNVASASGTMQLPWNDAKSGSILMQAKWQPDQDHDAKLLDKLQEPAKQTFSSSRATYGRSGVPRILGGVALEVIPASIRALLEEMDDAAKGNDVADPAYPGIKKRRFQELADTVDRTLVIDHDAETVSIHHSCPRTG